MVANNLQVDLHITLDDVLRGYFMQRRRSLLTELDDLEKLLGISPRTSEMRKREKALNPPPQYQCELEYQKREEKEG